MLDSQLGLHEKMCSFNDCTCRVSTTTPYVANEISKQPSLINTGVDKGAAIIGSDVSITNGCLGRYLGTALVLTITLADWKEGV